MEISINCLQSLAQCCGEVANIMENGTSACGLNRKDWCFDGVCVSVSRREREQQRVGDIVRER